MAVLGTRSSPEERWLAHLARAAAGAIRAGDGFDDDHPLAAEALHVLARRHRLSPLLHRGVGAGRIADPLPDPLRRALAADHAGALRKNVVNLELGARVLRRLAAAGITAAPLKGWALVEGPGRVYADPGERPMDDLDLIVARADVEAAETELAGEGFAPVGTRRSARLAGGHEMAWHRRLGGVDCFVELHWAWAGSESLMRGFALSGERFLAEGCAPVGADGTFWPRPAAHLVFVAVHAARHAFSRWLWLLDLHRLVEAGGFEWRAVLAAATRWRARRPLWAGLHAARELFRTPVPKEVLRALAPGPVRRGLVARSLAAQAESPHARRPGRVARLLLGESWWYVARTAAWAVAPGRAWYARRELEPGLARRITHPLRALRLEARERSEGGQA